jgi:hypothetical protein
MESRSRLLLKRATDDVDIAGWNGEISMKPTDGEPNRAVSDSASLRNQLEEESS